MAVIKRLPAKSFLIFIQNQRGGTVSAQPTMPTTRPRTAPNTPTTSDAGDGASNRYKSTKYYCYWTDELEYPKKYCHKLLSETSIFLFSRRHSEFHEAR